MTLDQALALHEGDYITHSQDAVFNERGQPVRRPIRVTKVWVNDRRTFVRLRLASLKTASQDWLDAEGYDLVPAGQAFDRVANEWVTTAELRARQAARRTPR